MASKEELQSVEQMERVAEELDKKIAETERLEEEGLQKFEEETKAELRKKLDHMQKSVTETDHTNRFTDLDQRIDAYRKGSITAVQTDVLRVNKIIRDVSRSLGAQWKDVFVYIMAGLPKETIDREVAVIEKERPFMQAYKALMRWKDLKSENFDLGQLIEALNVWDKSELAQHVEAILYSEGDDLLKIQNVGRGIASGSADAAGEEAEVTDNGTTEEGAAAKPRPTIRASQTISADPLNDGSLLRMSKKIGGDWLQLAQMLGVAEEDVEEIKGNEGMTYQGAFKALWTWRDRTSEEDVNQLSVLKEALKECKMDQVLEILPPES